MGQSVSTPRDPPEPGHPDYAPFSLNHNPGVRNEDMSNRQNTEQGAEAGSSSGMQQRAQNGQDIAPDQLHGLPESWQQPMSHSGGFSQQMRSIEEEEPSEHEATTQEYRSAAIARMAARRQSTMSRLGSRILPNSVIRGLLNSQEETPAEGLAHRHGLVSRTPPRSESAQSSGRFSPFSSLGSRGVIRRRTTRGPYFVPQRTDTSVMSDGVTSPSLVDPTIDGLPESNRASWRRARLQRVRHSLSTPISHIFGQPTSDVSSPHDGSAHLSRSSSFSDGLPSAMDTRLDFGEPLPELDSVEPSAQPDRPLSGHQTNAGLLGSRAIPSLLRARAARAIRREEQTPLSRVLQLAAAAIAAQLSGNTGPALPNIQALGNEGLDGSLENFIQTLQHATTAPAQSSSVGESPTEAGGNAPAAPMNFLRVFRFANSDSPLGTGPLSRGRDGPETPAQQSDRMFIDEPSEGGEGRTVTLVVVGVRSVPPSTGANGETGPAAPTGAGLDALLGLPFLPPNILPRSPESAGDPTQRADARTRLHAPRQGGPAGLAPDTPRQPGPPLPRRNSFAGSLPRPSAMSAMSDSPPGPHPPPSTPAEAGLSAVSSGTSTPSHRPSSASALFPNDLPHIHENQSLQPTVEPSETSAPPSAARQRRRSDSEFARHRALGSGAVRRNGVVEPDQPPPSGGRSWLIYVVGTNLSENHPALTTPSLFTDNPTYEDMILLSSLLGPAKPPVASQDDINSAGGLFRLVEYSGSLIAESVDGAGAIQIQDGERCLICLSDYEVAEEVRQIIKCKHVFHKDCIDQWLTTGRNSCPLCRGEGVKETSSNEGPSTGEPVPAPPPAEGTTI